MAITQTQFNHNESASGVSTIATLSYTPTVDRLVVLAVWGARTAGTSNIPTISADTTGLNWVQITSVAGSNTGSFALFRAMKPSGLGAGTTTASWGGQTQDFVWVSVAEYDGIDTSGTDGSGAVVQSAVNQSGGAQGGSLTATLAAFGSANNGTLFGAGWFDPETGLTTVSPNAGFTEFHEFDYVNRWAVHANWRADNSTACTSTLDAGTGFGVLAAFEIKAAAGGPPPDVSGVGQTIFRLARHPWR